MALQAWQRAAGQDADGICEPPKTATIQASPEAAGNSLRLTDSPRLWRGRDRDEEKKDVKVIVSPAIQRRRRRRSLSLTCSTSAKRRNKLPPELQAPIAGELERQLQGANPLTSSKVLDTLAVCPIACCLPLPY